MAIKKNKSSRSSLSLYPTRLPYIYTRHLLLDYHLSLHTRRVMKGFIIFLCRELEYPILVPPPSGTSKQNGAAIIIHRCSLPTAKRVNAIIIYTRHSSGLDLFASRRHERKWYDEPTLDHIEVV